MFVDHEVLTLACNQLGVRLLVLFGSHAPGGLAPRPESDIDVAVAFRADVTRPDWFDVYEALAPAFRGAALDLVILGNIDPLFRWEIMDRGIRLYGDVDEFLEYRAFAYRDFIDSADLRALEQTLSERKMALIRERIRAAS